MIEVLYTKIVPAVLTHSPVRIAGIDLGLANLITLVNNIGEQPIESLRIESKVTKD